MEKARRLHQSTLTDELKYNERMIKTLEKSIESIESSMSAGKDLDFYENRIERTKQSIEQYKAKNEAIEQKLLYVNQGGCDEEIKKKNKEFAEETQKKKEAEKKKEDEEKEKEKERKEIGHRFYVKEMDEQRYEGNMEKLYFRLCDIVASLPDYISKNLKSMPNNKGYKFRGAVFYGELPAERNAPVIVFEKKFNGMNITETYNDNEVTFFKPKDGSPKQIVKKVLLRKNVNAPATRISVM
jgi:hypothetical protein